MATVYDVEPNKLIEELAKKLSTLENVKSPEWAAFVKTGTSKERVPSREDWWYVRAAAILRSIYRSRGPIGVQKLRIKYGSKKNRGHKPEKFFKASGKIIRLIIQQLEKEELVKQTEVGVHKGRILTGKGKSLLDKTASGVVKLKPKKKLIAKVVPVEKPAEPKVEQSSEVKPAPKKEKPVVPKEEQSKEKPAEASEKQEAPKEEKPAEPKKEPAESKPEPKAEEAKPEEPKEAEQTKEEAPPEKPADEKKEAEQSDNQNG